MSVLFAISFDDMASTKDPQLFGGFKIFCGYGPLPHIPLIMCVNRLYSKYVT